MKSIRGDTTMSQAQPSTTPAPPGEYIRRWSEKKPHPWRKRAKEMEMTRETAKSDPDAFHAISRRDFSYSAGRR
jgi:hypothetical protein